MNRYAIFLVITILAILSTGCQSSSPETLSQLTVPQVWVDAPRDGSELPLAPVEVVAHAADVGGTAVINLRVNNQMISQNVPEDPTASLTTIRQIWTPTEPGNYTLQLQSQNMAGAWSAFAQVVVTIVGDDDVIIPPNEELTMPVDLTATATETAVSPATIATSTSTTSPSQPTATSTLTPLPPTATFTSLPPTTTFTPIPPTATFTPLPPTSTFTPIPPTSTSTPMPPTSTFTPIPPTSTSTPLPDIRPPAISIDYAPQAYGHPTEAEIITFTATAGDNVGIARIDFHFNGGRGGSLGQLVHSCENTTICIFNGGPYPPGTIRMLAVATDTAGNQTVSETIEIPIWVVIR